MNPNNIIREVQAIIVDKNSKHFLLIHRKGYFDKKFIWRLVKGRLNEDESDKEALKREIKEETGLSKIEIKEKLDEYSFTNPQGLKFHVNCYLIYASETDELFCNDPKEQIQDYRWLKTEDALRMLYFDEEKRSIKKAEEYL